MKRPAVPPRMFGRVAACLPGQGGLDERDADGVPEGAGHGHRVFQQVVAVDDRGRGSGQGLQKIEKRALFGKADLGLIKIGPFVMDRGYGFGRVADQEGVGEVDRNSSSHMWLM